MTERNPPDLPADQASPAVGARSGRGPRDLRCRLRTIWKRWDARRAMAQTLLSSSESGSAMPSSPAKKEMIA